jgi:hypothetical protein
VITRTLPPSHTPEPPFTPRPTLTLTPGATPGVFRQDENRLVVILLTGDLNAAIARAYTSQGLTSPSAPPVIALGQSGRVQIRLKFYNDFLQEDSRVTVQALLSASGGRIALNEIASERTAEGALVSDQTLRAALLLVETGINDAVTGMAQGQADALRLSAVQVYPDHLEAVFTPD